MVTIADLSEWQGTIDFAKLSKVVDLVILRVQDGTSHVDAKYKEYVTGCKRYGIPFGTYAFFRGINVPDGITEAKNALARMDANSKFFAVDVEVKTASDLLGSVQAFIDYLKNKGVQKVGLYSGEHFYSQQGLNQIKADFTWIANYGKNDGETHTKPTIACDLWQYTSVGRLDGINTKVDLNTLNGGKSLHWFSGVPYKVIIPNTAFWQAKGLVNEFEQRGYKCYGSTVKVYKAGEVAEENDPFLFTIETTHDEAVNLVIELKQRGYERAYGEEIK